MKNILVLLASLIMLSACSASMNGVGASVGQTYFAPYAPEQETTAVVYIYWNQRDIERYIPFGARKPEWHTYVNRKRNAELEQGGYSVVEVNPGRVNIEARMRFGASNNSIDDRPANISISAKAGETYFVYARLGPGSVGGSQLQLDREISEREAYQWLYGLRYMENLQDSMLY